MQIVQYSQKPERILYIQRKDGTAEAWLRKDIHKIKDSFNGEESNIWVATEVMIETHLTEEEVENQFDSFFRQEEPPVTIEDLSEALNILTNIVLGGA